MAAEDEILQYTDVQHIKTKEMYAGQLQPILYNNMHTTLKYYTRV